MPGFPTGLSSLQLSPFHTIEEARSDGGFIWEDESADPYWRGRASTGKLNHDRLQDWEGFVEEAVSNRTIIDWVDPIYSLPAAYRASVLPGGFSGTGTLVNLTNAFAPVVSGLPIGLILRRGDRLMLRTGSGAYQTCHMVSATITVTSNTAQAVPIAPMGLTNVFAAGALVIVKDPAIRLTIVPNSWAAPRRAGVDTIGSFEVTEATVPA